MISSKLQAMANYQTARNSKQQQNSMGLELHTMANYQLNNNIKQLAAILGVKETRHTKCSHTYWQELHLE
jgi:hypothetical protein